MNKDLWKEGLDGTSQNVSCNSDATCNLGLSIVKFIAQDSANKLDSREQLIDGKEIEKAFPEEMVKALKISEWKRLRKKLGKRLSISGNAALVVDLIEGQPFISIGDLVKYTKIAGELREVILDAKQIVEENEVEYPVYEVFYFEGNMVQKMFAIRKDDMWIAQEEAITYPSSVTRIPVKIFENNEDAVSDIDNVKMWDCIDQLNRFSNKFEGTFDLAKLGLIVNRNMTGGKTGSQILRELKEKGVIEVNGMDSQLGAGVQPTGGVGYMTEMMLFIDWLEDKIMKYTFTTRDTTSSGTNKHNAEIGMFNQFAIEYLLDKKEIREDDYADFYKILGMFFNEDSSDIKVELQISQVLQNMLDAMNPETPRVQENINKDETGGEDVGTKPEGN